MSDKRYDQIYERIQESYPNACMLYIDEVINEPLLCAYKTRKEKLKAEEKQLFHGTSDNLIDVIAEMGFDPTKNKVAVYGYGVYFAKNAQYSFNYMKSADTNDISYMFIANIIIGKVKYNLSEDDGDTYVDNVRTPTIFCMPLKEQTLPKYLVAFHKNAV
jgi:hypothetical protein